MTALADAVTGTAPLLARYLVGFDDDNATAQAPGLPNHVAWTLGHLALTMHRAAERIAGEHTDLGWDPEPFVFGSRPTERRDDYPPLNELIARFQRAIDLFAATLRAASDRDLDREIQWGSSFTTVRDLAMRMVFHNGTHCGQLVDLRRALGMPGVIR